MPGRQTRERAAELSAIAPLTANGELIGPCTLITNGKKTIAFTSAELLRVAAKPLAIVTKLDGSATIPVASWMLGRRAGIGIIELGDIAIRGDVAPLPLAAVCATVDTRGGPAALVAIEPSSVGRAAGFSRRVVPVYVDAVDAGPMSDDALVHLASPSAALDIDAPIEGAGLFAWLPPDPVLGRPSEVVVVALAITYRTRAFKPRDLPAVAELIGLDDLASVLPVELAAESSNELDVVAGEIRTPPPDDDPLDGLDED